MPSWELEVGLHRMGYSAVAGVDEAGRGALAGPVYTAAVILPIGVELPALDDSKRLAPETRDDLHGRILELSESAAVEPAPVAEVAEKNVLGATLSAMSRAVEALDPPADFALIDGDREPAMNTDSRPVVKGDSRSFSIAAASILAKVERDRLMVDLAERHPEYCWDSNMGYSTREHRRALDRHGPCEFHRRGFEAVAQSRLFSESA